MGGTLYTVSSGGAVAAYTPDYFDHGDWGAGSVATSVTFIASVVAGNFSVDHEDDNYVGQEEVAFVIGMKQAGASKYYYKLGMIGGKTYMGGTATEYYSNDIDSNDYTFAGEFGDINSPLNLVLAAVDNDVDGMMAQYIGKKYAYTDPTVEAVLQSAPYFGDLGTYDDFNNGETSYSVSTTYEFELSSTSEKSLGIGAEFEGSAFFGKVQIEAGSLQSWSKEFVQSQATTISTEYSVGEDNQVIIKRTPVTIYLYAMEDAGSWPKTDITDTSITPEDFNKHYLQISVPGTPTTYVLSVERYNEFVEYYNNYITSLGSKVTEKYPIRSLNKITDPSLLDNMGDPWAYRSNWNTAAGEYAAKQLGEKVNELSHSGGTTTSSWEYEEGTSDSVSYSSGASFGLTISAGFEGVGFEVWGGVSSSFEYENGEGTTSSQSTATGVSGAVNNLSGASRYAPYQFKWSLGKWELDLGGVSGKVPVFGYCVTNIAAPAAVVEDLRVTYDESTQKFTFTWTDPDDPSDDSRTHNLGFNLYQVDGDDYKPINTTMIPKGTTTYTTAVPSIGGSNFYTFLITSVSDQPSLGNPESEYSSEVNYILGANGKSAYELAQDNGFTGTVAEWLQSIVGASGKGITSITKTATGAGANSNLDTYTITYTDNSTTTFTVANGINGTNGADGREVLFQVGADGYLQWQYVGDTTWTDLISVTTGTGVAVVGEKGADGREIELRTSAGIVQWRYVGAADDTWTDLITLAELTGSDARDVEFQYFNDKLQWRYVTPSVVWNYLDTDANLVALSGATLDTSKTVTYRVEGGYLQWSYIGEDSWTSIKPVTGITTLGEIHLQKIAGGLNWGLVPQEYTWSDLASAADLRGDAGKQIKLQKKDGYLQWQYDGDTTWTNLIPLSDLQGLQGDAGAGITEIKWGSRTGDVDTYVITYANGQTVSFTVANGAKGDTGAAGAAGADGRDGADGRNGANGTNGTNGVDGINGTNGTNGRDGTNGIDGVNGINGINGIDGQNGINGVGIANINVDTNGDLIFTMTDGSLINAGSYKDAAAPEVTVDKEQKDSNTSMIILWCIAVLSLVWNAALTAVYALNKKGISIFKKGGTPLQG